MRAKIHLCLNRRDWCSYGFLNVSQVFLGFFLLLLSLVMPFVIWFRPIDSWPPELLLCPLFGLLTLLIHQSALNSMIASISRRSRPIVSFSNTGIVIDGGPLERWSFTWSEIDAFAPSLDWIGRGLTEGRQVFFSFSVAKKPSRRLFGQIQHSKFHNLFEVSGYFVPLSPNENERLIGYIKKNVDNIQLYLTSEME